MDWMKRAVRVVLRAILRWSEFHPIRGYARVSGATIFPAQNAHFLKAPEGLVFHDVFFNLWEDVIIEEGAAVAHQVMFLTGHHAHSEDAVIEKPLTKGSIRVCSGAWVASRAIIMGGVEIGPGAFVGAGSVVTRSVPANEFWAGSPARLVRKL